VSGGCNRLFVALVCAVVALGMGVRMGDYRSRPLEHDEISSLNAYSSVGFVGTIDEMLAKPRFSFEDTARGIVRAVADWRAPNNHVVHGLAVSAHTFFAGFTERSVRGVASWALALLTAGAMVWARNLSGSVWFAGLAGMLVTFHPYFIHYGQTARGYTVGALLVVAHGMLVERFRGRTPGAVFFAIMVLLGYAAFLNLISAVFMWLAPLYLCALFWNLPEGCGGWAGRLRGAFQDRAWRYWVLQGLVVGGLVGQFCLQHLRELGFSQYRWGVKGHDAGEIAGRWGKLFEYLFPGPCWWGVAALAAAGGLLMLRPRKGHWLGPVAAVSLAASLAYSFSMLTVPYNRTFGVFIVFALFALGWLWKEVGGAPLAARAGVRALVAAAMVCALAGSVGGALDRIPNADYSSLAMEIRRDVEKGRLPARETFVMRPYIHAEEMRFYLPTDSEFVTMEAGKSDRLSVYFPCWETGGGYGFRCQYTQWQEAEFRYWLLPEAWAGHKIFSRQQTALFRVPMRMFREGDAPPPDAYPKILLWVNREKYFNLRWFVWETLKLPEWREVLALTTASPNQTSAAFFVSDEREEARAGEILGMLAARAPGSRFTLVGEP
jgi:hypothetical protein